MVGAERNPHPQIISRARMTFPTIQVSRRGADRLRAGHPWIYRSDVAAGAADPGDLVRVVSERDRPIGWAFWSSASQIALRFWSTATGPEVPDEPAWFGERLRAAAAYRASLDIDASAWRLVHGEADRLPGLVIDRYADESGVYLVLQTLSQATDRRLPMLVDLLVQAFEPAGILARNDPKVRRLEGLGEQVEVVYGAVPERVSMREGRITVDVDLRAGQKTGAFLDQRENHLAAARVARGRALDAFAYNGGFALQMADRTDTVLAIDASAAAVAATTAHARANRMPTVQAREGNVFDELRELDTAGERFDTIVLDPPAFARNRAAVERALAGYKEINLRAIRLLAPHGHLITCSCSYNVSESMFLDVVQAAAADAHATLVLVEKRMQARDHPVLVNVPETYYLKCFILRRID
jgi:23S rRNA (cytosine1962-C5)-methyltransferase